MSRASFGGQFSEHRCEYGASDSQGLLYFRARWWRRVAGVSKLPRIFGQGRRLVHNCGEVGVNGGALASNFLQAMRLAEWLVMPSEQRFHRFLGGLLRMEGSVLQ